MNLLGRIDYRPPPEVALRLRQLADADDVAVSEVITGLLCMAWGLAPDAFPMTKKHNRRPGGRRKGPRTA